MKLREVLDAVSTGQLTAEAAEKYLEGYGFVEVGYHRIDSHRSRRTGLPEVVLGLRKSVEQLREIAAYFSERHLPLLITRLTEDKADVLKRENPAMVFEPSAGIMRLGTARERVEGDIAIVAAGSSDRGVAEEAAVTLEFFGMSPHRVYDCGVAGLHRLFASAGTIAECDVIIAVAGMEGALPSVLGGMFNQPIIAVPTSVGYGASFDGLAALLTMMNSCAPGITVVNIDNGFGAAVAAHAMMRLAAKRAASAVVS